MSFFTKDDFNEESKIFNLTQNEFEFLAEKIASKVARILKNEQQDQGSELLTIKEVKDHFGISRSTLQRWEKIEYLLPVRFGKKVLFRVRDISKAIT